MDKKISKKLWNQAKVLVPDDQWRNTSRTLGAAIGFCERTIGTVADGIVLAGPVVWLVCGGQIVKIQGLVQDAYEIDVIPLARIQTAKLNIENIGDATFGLEGDQWDPSWALTLTLNLDTGKTLELQSSEHHSKDLIDFFQANILPALKP